MIIKTNKIDLKTKKKIMIGKMSFSPVVSRSKPVIGPLGPCSQPNH